MESILNSVKKLLGIAEEYTQFDTDLVIDINSVFSILTQLGVGPQDGFSISDESTVWGDFLQDKTLLEFVKTYMYLKVKLLFDPPLSSAVMNSITQLISELEWRINVAVDPGWEEIPE